MKQDETVPRGRAIGTGPSLLTVIRKHAGWSLATRAAPAGGREPKLGRANVAKPFLRNVLNRLAGWSLAARAVPAGG